MFIDATIFLEIVYAGDDAPLFIERIKNSRRQCNTSAAVRLDVIKQLAEVRSEGRAMSSEDMATATTIFERLRDALKVYEVLVSPRIANDACSLYAVFGEASAHKAQLTLSDCLTLAAAENVRLPVLSARKGFKEISEKELAAWHKGE